VFRFRRPSRLPSLLSARVTAALDHLGHHVSHQTVGNILAERWVRSVKQECLTKLILFEELLRRALSEFIDRYHSERNHQGKGKLLLFPSPGATTNQVVPHHAVRGRR
jgi:hypothetical protein